MTERYEIVNLDENHGYKILRFEGDSSVAGVLVPANANVNIEDLMHVLEQLAIKGISKIALDVSYANSGLSRANCLNCGAIAGIERILYIGITDVDINAFASAGEQARAMKTKVFSGDMDLAIAELSKPWYPHPG